MRIIDAEPQLLAEILEEMAVINTHPKKRYTVYTGRHPELGRMIIIESRDGSAIIEIDEN